MLKLNEQRDRVHTRDNDRITVASKLNRLDPAIVSTPSPGRAALLDIPKKDLAVAAYASEARIIRGNR